MACTVKFLAPLKSLDILALYKFDYYYYYYYYNLIATVNLQK